MGQKPLALLLFSLGPFGFAFTFRLDYQADGGDDGEKSFRKVFDYFAKRFIHLSVPPFYGFIIAHIIVLVKRKKEKIYKK